MAPRFCLVVGLASLVVLMSRAGLATAQPTIPSPPPVDKDQRVELPNAERPAPPPPTSDGRDTARPAKKADGKSEGLLSDLLTAFIFVTLLVGIIIGLVLVVSLFFQLRTPEDPVEAALDDAWVQGRLRELEASPPAADENAAADLVPVEQAEVR